MKTCRHAAIALCSKSCWLVVILHARYENPNSNAAGTHASRNAANVRKTYRHTTTPAAPGILLPLELFTDGTSRQRGILFSPQKLNFERKN
ncbi:hypothetical protein [Chitinophaga sp. CB10]|uniref:hypothetical protein n=1 Tax=Chitinophaga sp. CB10 TaxID=1891659 RepID=UPI0025B95BE0|nr:hypothetical protein [Chitinophaga sp. CB10]